MQKKKNQITHRTNAEQPLRTKKMAEDNYNNNTSHIQEEKQTGKPDFTDQESVHKTVKETEEELLARRTRTAPPTREPSSIQLRTTH